MMKRCDRHRDSANLPLGCVTCVRIKLEATIVKKTVLALLAAGYRLQVRDDEGSRPVSPSASASEVLEGLMETDDEFLVATDPDGRTAWVRFVYGNDGYDVISDYTTSLEDVLAPVNAYADRQA